jgi:hypothetical protein
MYYRWRCNSSGGATAVEVQQQWRCNSSGGATAVEVNAQQWRLLLRIHLHLHQ